MMAHTDHSNANWKCAAATYAKAIVFLAPALICFAALEVFVVPKLKQICADAAFDARSFFAIFDLARDRGILLLAILAIAFLLLEWRLGLWAKYRRFVIGTLVFLLNTAIIIGISAFAVLFGIVAPALLRR